ncbi:MAG: hypothetical protein H7301_09155 [Cryobacterium sp.]|nr:hypothetical protein [Oligoflexia bacterium]
MKWAPILVPIFTFTFAVPGYACDCSEWAGSWTNEDPETQTSIQIVVTATCDTNLNVTQEAPLNSARVESLFCEGAEVKSQFRMAPGSVDRDGVEIAYPHSEAIQKALVGSVRFENGSLYFGLMDVEDRFVRD